MTHAWLPASPCNEGCLPRAQECVRRWVVALRKVGAVLALCVLPFLLMVRVMPRSAQHRLIRISARTLLTVMGIRLHVRDSRSASVRARTEGGALIVAGHVSWIDIIVLAAVRPATFVARADLIAWPLLGRIARAARIVPIDRGRLRDLPHVVDQIAERLRAGGSVALFPEATTWCGLGCGTFRPALFQAAVDAEVWVQPMRITYLDNRGNKTTGPCFVGEETIGQSISRILTHRGTNVDVVFGAPQVPGFDRRDLAIRCEREIRHPQSHDVDRRHLVATVISELREPIMPS